MAAANIACEARGDLAPELRDAVVAFAHSSLVIEIDKLTGYHSVAIETAAGPVGCDRPDHPDGLFTEIVATPTTRDGELVIAQREIFHGHCSWGAEIRYCLHTRYEAAGVTVLVENGRTVIGMRPQLPQHHASRGPRRVRAADGVTGGGLPRP